MHSKFGIPAANHEPVDWITGYDSTNFTSEFLERCHEFIPNALYWLPLLRARGPAAVDLASVASLLQGGGFSLFQIRPHAMLSTRCNYFTLPCSDVFLTYDDRVFAR